MKTIAIKRVALPLMALAGVSSLWLSLRQLQRKIMCFERKHATVTPPKKKEMNSQSHALVAQHTATPQLSAGPWRIRDYSGLPENLDNEPNAQSGIVEVSKGGSALPSGVQPLTALSGFTLVRGTLSWRYIDSHLIEVDVYYTDDEHLRDEVAYFRDIVDPFSETRIIGMYLTDNGKNNPWCGMEMVSYFTIEPLS